MRRFRKFCVGAAAIGLISLILIKLVDLALWTYLPDDLTPFPPLSRALFKSSEFDAVASINQFGFRGDETVLRKGQILVFGDSFTFGFGSRDDQTWARTLRDNLRDTRLALDVYNLGVPGTDTDLHLDLAIRYAASLEPKIVIVSVLIADDFQQVYEATRTSRWGTGLREAGLIGLGIAFPGLKRFIHRTRNAMSLAAGSDAPPMPVTADWARNARRILERKGIKLPDDLRDQALAGNINPGIFSLLAAFPDRSWRLWSSLDSDPQAQELTNRLTDRFKQLNALVQAKGGRLIVMAMPEAPFVRSAAATNYQRYGFTVRDEDFTGDAPERVLRALAANAGTGFIPALERFRQHSGPELFFPMDGHLTTTGNALVADIVKSALLASDGAAATTKP